MSGRQEINWPREFEAFMAKRKFKVDGKFIPAWDLWCFMFSFCSIHKDTPATIDLYLEASMPEDYVISSYTFLKSPIGYLKSIELHRKWLEHTYELKIRRARKEAFAYGF